MASGTVTVTIVLKNKKAVRALACAKESIDEASESQPWNMELKKASRAIQYAVRNLAVERKR